MYLKFWKLCDLLYRIVLVNLVFYRIGILAKPGHTADHIGLPTLRNWRLINFIYTTKPILNLTRKIKRPTKINIMTQKWN